MRSRIQGLGFQVYRDWGLGLSDWGLGRDWGLGFGDWGLGIGVQGLGFRVYRDCGYGDWRLGCDTLEEPETFWFRDWCLAFQNWG